MLVRNCNLVLIEWMIYLFSSFGVNIYSIQVCFCWKYYAGHEEKATMKADWVDGSDVEHNRWEQHRWQCGRVFKQPLLRPTTARDVEDNSLHVTPVVNQNQQPEWNVEAWLYQYLSDWMFVKLSIDWVIDLTKRSERMNDWHTVLQRLSDQESGRPTSRL